MVDTSKLNILVVDDNPAGLYCLTHILEHAGFNVMQAATGQRALTLASERPDLIILDVHLPDLNGFEVCTRLKADSATAVIPILQISANYIRTEDQVFGLETGADGYLTAPIEPKVLVATVKTLIRLRQVEEQTRVVAEQWRMLAAASLLINASLSVDETLRLITEQARVIIGTHQAVTSITLNADWAQAINAISLSDKYQQWRDYQAKPDGSGIYSLVCSTNSLMRMTQAELEAHPDWRQFGKEHEDHPPLRGWLAAPLIGRDGRNIGLIQLSDKYQGEFTLNDEPLIMQLAQMASLAIENSRLYLEAQNTNLLKDEFLATVSHELRTPLTAMLGWLRLLRTGRLEETQALQALETVERNAKAQAQLIEDLLDISRIITGKLHLETRPIEIAPIIEAVINSLCPVADNKQIKIEQRINKVALIAGDVTRLQQVIWNLLSNAIKFTPEHGSIEVRLEQVNSQIEITVSDTGKGITAKFLPHIFDRFVQADTTITRKHGGLGLGLAIVRHIVELHGGKIEAESPGEGQGAIFRLTLPITVASPDSWRGEQHDSDNSTIFNHDDLLRGLRILVVDDDADTREVIALMLDKCGAEVSAAASAEEAFIRLDSWHPDLLISDLGMPVVDGFELMRRIRAREIGQREYLPAIALSAYTRGTDQLRARLAGFQLHVSKPVEPAELIKAIGNLIRKRV